MKIKILPYKKGSKSAKALAAELGCKQLKLEGSKWRPRIGDVVINWGSSNANHPVFGFDHVKILNHPDQVADAANKLSSFEAFKAAGVKTPAWTTDKAEAEKWFDAGSVVVCRKVLNGHSGAGIVIAEQQDQLVDAPLYTKYINKQEEYRLHVIGDQVVFQQRKARVKDVPDEEVNWKIRNLKGGFIYAIQNVNVCDDAKALAVAAVKALKLDFGAVDIILTKSQKWFVLEVNTACGLEGTTLQIYAEHLNKLARG